MHTTNLKPFYHQKETLYPFAITPHSFPVPTPTLAITNLLSVSGFAYSKLREHSASIILFTLSRSSNSL